MGHLIHQIRIFQDWTVFVFKALTSMSPRLSYLRNAAHLLWLLLISASFDSLDNATDS